MRIRNIDHFVLVTENLEKCLAFYAGVLGMEHVCRDGRHAVKFGGQKINIHTRPGEFTPFARNPVAGSADFCLSLQRGRATRQYFSRMRRDACWACQRGACAWSRYVVRAQIRVLRGAFLPFPQYNVYLLNIS